MQKLLSRFFRNGDDPDFVYEDTIARDDDEDDVKFSSFYFFLRLVIFFRSADVVWRKELF